MRHDEQRGVALVITLVALALLSAIGVGLVLATSTDVLIAANAGAAGEALYAADALFDRTLAELRTVADLTPVLNGSLSSAFVDGAPSGQRTLADGSILSLDSILNLAKCQKPSSCTETEMNASLRNRPWGVRNPRWRLFAYGALRPPAGSTGSDLPVYVVSMVADDPRETDGDPWRDGGPTGSVVNPGAGIALVRAEAFGRRNAHRIVQGLVIRRDRAAFARWDVLDPDTRGPAPPDFPVLQVLAWEEIR
jgi:hypothetical protein